MKASCEYMCIEQHPALGNRQPLTDRETRVRVHRFPHSKTTEAVLELTIHQPIIQHLLKSVVEASRKGSGMLCQIHEEAMEMRFVLHCSRTRVARN